MQTAATIRDVARRLEEASSIFRLKARTTGEGFEEVSAIWTDERAQNFVVRYIRPQNEAMEEGARLCHFQAELINSAYASAENAERELSSYFAACNESESEASISRSSAQTAREQASRATSEAARAANEIQSIRSGIDAAAQDPGW